MRRDNKSHWGEQRRIDRLLAKKETAVECVAKALFRRDVDEDVCDGTWEENPALHERILTDAQAAIDAYHDYIRRNS